MAETAQTPEQCKMMEGRSLRRTLLAQVAEETVKLNKKGILPSLHVVLVGGSKEGQVYVDAKLRSAKQAGMDTNLHALPADTTQQDLEKLLRTLSDDDAAHGVLLQLPLPQQLDTVKALSRIAPIKDVDGLTPENAGLLLRGDDSGVKPCTPLGIMRLLEAYGVEVKGTNAVVLGRSQLVGHPLSEMLTQAGATVTTCQKNTENLAHYTKHADVLAVTTGNPALMTGDMLKPGAVVIDVGTNRLENNDVVGDCDETTCRTTASLLTPVPGGVGPMTVATLLTNTIDACCRQHELPLVAWAV